MRSSSSPILRSTTRNSIVTFNALQKVFRSRFEDGRTHTSLGHFSELAPHQPFLTGSRVGYEKLLGKSKSSFFTTTVLFSKPLNHLNIFNSLLTSLNFPFYDFPFLLSAKSDQSRYMWFD
jgi:hypothetical protein